MVLAYSGLQGLYVTDKEQGFNLVDINGRRPPRSEETDVRWKVVREKSQAGAVRQRNFFRNRIAVDRPKLCSSNANEGAGQTARRVERRPRMV